jgi:hypothetical protein
MSLPEPWVEKIFRKLSATYGAAFQRQYDGVDLADVKANWAHELAVFQQAPDAIAYGLDHLPADHRPPTVLQFRDLCRRPTEHATSTLKLPLPKPDPVIARAIRDAWKPVGTAGPRAWAERFRDREERGERLTQAQRTMWRAALSAEAPAQEAA